MFPAGHGVFELSLPCFVGVGVSSSPPFVACNRCASIAPTLYRQAFPFDHVREQVAVMAVVVVGSHMGTGILGVMDSVDARDTLFVRCSSTVPIRLLLAWKIDACDSYIY